MNKFLPMLALFVISCYTISSCTEITQSKDAELKAQSTYVRDNFDKKESDDSGENGSSIEY